MLRAVRTFFKLLKSGRTPDQIAVGASLGLLIGLTPFGGHSLILLALTLMLQCSFRAMLLTALLSTPLSYALAVPSYRLGILLLEGSETCRSIAAWLNDWPVLALSGWHRYWMFGSAVVALIAVAAAYIPIRSLVKRYRASWGPKVGQSAWAKRAEGSKAMRALHWLFLGGMGPPKEPVQRAIWNPERFIRWTGVVAVLGLTIGVYAAASIAAATVVPSAVESQMGPRLGAPVEVQATALDPFSWTMTIEGLRVPDPDREDVDIVRFGNFSAQLHLIDLLAMRVNMDHIRLEDVSLHVRRNPDGSLNLERIDPDIGEDRRTAWREWLEWLKEEGRDADWNEAAARLRELMQRAGEVVEGVTTYPQDLPFDRSAGATLDRLSPLLRIGEIAVTNLDLEVRDERPEGASLPHLTRASAAVRNVVFPNPDNLPMEVSFDGGLSASPDASLGAQGSMQPASQRWNVNLDGVPLAELRGIVEENTGLRIEDGFALSATDLSLEGDAIDAQVNLALARLRVSAADGISLFGLDPSLTPHVVNGINIVGERAENIAFAFFIRGTLAAPEFDWDVNWLELARLGLQSLGDRALDGVIHQLNGQIESLSPEHVAAQMTGEFAGMQETAMESLLSGDTGGIEGALENMNPLGQEGEGESTNPLDNILGGDNPLEGIMGGDDDEETPNPLDRINPFRDD